MFATPRPKKPLLPPPSKKRKLVSGVEEVSFDNDARHEFLTGFHKRKLQRKKHAQEQAAKQARQEKIDTRKQVREDRRREVEEHVKNVNKMLRESGMVADPSLEETSDDDNDSDEFTGFPDAPRLEIVDHEEEYIDEDRYTTVTVESVAITRDGLTKPLTQEEHEARERVQEAKKREYEAEEEKQRRAARLKKEKKDKKKKFTYENKVERRLAEAKRRIKSKSSR